MGQASAPDHPIVTAIKGEVGEGLRSVAVYQDGEYALLYLREDVDSIYSSEEIDAVFEGLSARGLSKAALEDLFNAGTLQCAVLGFEDAMMFHFVKSDSQGLFVTYDRGAGVQVAPFIRTCEEQL